MKVLTAGVLLVAATIAGRPVPSSAQAAADSTQRTITIPAPENGVIYIRSGPPGGVRIRSVRSQTPVQERPARAASIDLERLARVFDGQGLDLYAERVYRGNDVVVILRDAATGAVADTLSEEEARNLVETFGAPPAAEGPPPSPMAEAPPPTRDTLLVERIERSFLEVGLFRSLQIHFEFDRSDLLPTSRPTVESVAEVMRRHPDLVLEVGGHTDAVGTRAYNETLSRRRAASVVRALEKEGVAPSRLEANGYGEDHPILTNETPTGRALNRRVEFRVIDGAPVEER